MHPTFESFSTAHFGALAVFVLVTFLLIWAGRRSNAEIQKAIGFSIAALAFLIMLFDGIARLLTGRFDVIDDLPLFLCDVAACLLPFAIWNENRKWLGILYFWGVGGTLQALLTPELEEGFPMFEFFRYFIMHGAIVAAVLYIVIVNRLRIGWRDYFNAIVYAQFYLIAVHIINVTLQSNYSYTMMKPRDPTLLDFLGPWPWYLVWGELIMMILFLLLLIPFRLGIWREKS